MFAARIFIAISPSLMGWWFVASRLGFEGRDIVVAHATHLLNFQPITRPNPRRGLPPRWPVGAGRLRTPPSWPLSGRLLPACGRVVRGRIFTPVRGSPEEVRIEGGMAMDAQRICHAVLGIGA